MPRCALPDHLKDKKHNDWPWPMSYLPRSINAFGPRCPEGTKGHLPWPPKLVTGYDCTRWEWADLDGNNKQVYIPAFAEKTIGPEVYRVPWMDETGKLIDLSEDWWPSIIQYQSEHGYLELSPAFKCKWRTRPDWRRFYWRSGMRPDFDLYYNRSFVYLGRNFE